MSDFTIIIPHRGSGLGLWATIHSCEVELQDSKHDYNYVIVSNGEELGGDDRQNLFYLEKTGRLLKHIHEPEGLTPPAARARGVEAANGRFLFFFDNHCLVGKNYFDRAVLDMDYKNMDMLHSTTCFYTGEGYHYHYRLKLEYNFWAEGNKLPYDELRPYKLAAGGHGGFVVRRTMWDDIGGYGPEGLFIGYGGEEMVFDLKAWLYGKSNWIDPRVVHYHYTGTRGYDRHWTDDYYTNLLVCANVIGGEKWMYKLVDSLTNKTHIRLRPEKTVYEMMETAYQRSAQYAAEVASKRRCTLDELLEEFRRNLVAM